MKINSILGMKKCEDEVLVVCLIAVMVYEFIPFASLSDANFEVKKYIFVNENRENNEI